MVVDAAAGVEAALVVGGSAASWAAARVVRNGMLPGLRRTRSASFAAAVRASPRWRISFAAGNSASMATPSLGSIVPLPPAPDPGVLQKDGVYYYTNTMLITDDNFDQGWQLLKDKPDNYLLNNVMSQSAVDALFQ